MAPAPVKAARPTIGPVPEWAASAEIPPRPGELISENNRLSQRLTVIDKKIKVLYVEHPPRFEYRYLKNSLVRDPKILVHCILTSADPERSFSPVM